MRANLRYRASHKPHDERRVRASSRIRDISTYDEFSRLIDQTLQDDSLFERIRNEASALPAPAER